MTVEKLRVELGERSYDIVVGPGLLRNAGATAKPLVPRPPALIVTDETVAKLHLAALQASLSEHEAFGMAPVEAACAGARTVLSDIPAHRELVASYLGETAVIVAPAAAAAAITAQLAAPGRVAVDVPDWPRIAAATLDIYRRESPA